MHKRLLTQRQQLQQHVNTGSRIGILTSDTQMLIHAERQLNISRVCQICQENDGGGGNTVVCKCSHSCSGSQCRVPGIQCQGLETETLLASGGAAIPTLGELSVQQHNLCKKTKRKTKQRRSVGEESCRCVSLPPVSLSDTACTSSRLLQKSCSALMTLR